jgi:hypothetical protein
MATTDHVEEKGIPVEPRLRDGESFFKGKNNQLIIMGRDRPGDINSGYGASPGAGTVHIVVGRVSRDPSFKDDAAFVYTSMMTDVDANLGIEFSGGKGSYEAKKGSTVIAKADNIRLVHRQSGDIRITSDDGRNFIVLTPTGCEIKIGNSWLKIEEGIITIEGGTINLGKGASKEKVILGNSFKDQVFNVHTHQSPVGPTSAPLLQMTDAHLSKKSIVE